MATKKEKDAPKPKTSNKEKEKEVKIDIINPPEETPSEEEHPLPDEDIVNDIIDIQDELNDSKDEIEEKLSKPDADVETVIKAEIEHAQDMLDRLPDVPTTNVWNGVTYN